MNSPLIRSRPSLHACVIRRKFFLAVGKEMEIFPFKILSNLRVSIERNIRIGHRFLLKHHLPNSFSCTCKSFSPFLSRTLRIQDSSSSRPFFSLSSVQLLLSFRGMRTRDALLQIQMGTYANGATCYYTFPYTNNVLIGPRTSRLSVYAPWKPIYRSFCAHSFFSFFFFFLLVFFSSFLVEGL